MPPAPRAGPQQPGGTGPRTRPTAAVPDAAGPDAAGPQRTGSSSIGHESGGSSSGGSSSAGSESAGSESAGSESAGSVFRRSTVAARIALVYLATGCLWIAGSDWLLVRLLPEHLRMGQTAKGLAFVVLSASLIYALVRRELKRRHRLEDEREELHRRLAGSQRLEAVGRLTAGIAHDFNNLLTAVTGSIQSYTARVQEEGRYGEDLSELVDAASASERAAQLTAQLLAFGRRQKLRPEVVDIGAVIEEMGRLLRRLIGEHVRIQLDLDPDLWMVDLDPGPLEQVVMNLAINARDAMPDGGSLTIETANVRIDPETARHRFSFPFEPGEYVRLSVADTGTGMTATTRVHIFEPFFTTKHQDVGTGLGLSTVYGIVKQSGGYIDVETAPGQGARFDIFFPRSHRSIRRSTGDEPSPRAVEGNETIMVVEDEPAVRSLIVRTLERAGFEVFEAEEGRTALRRLEELDRPVHLLLTDAVMPGMSGIALIGEARVVHPELRVLLMSGYDPVDLDGVPFLSKPFLPDQLMQRVRRVLDAELEPGASPTLRAEER